MFKGFIAFVISGVISFIILVIGITLGFNLGLSSYRGHSNSDVASIFKIGYYSGARRIGEPDFDSWGQRAGQYLTDGNDEASLAMIQKQIDEINKQDNNVHSLDDISTL